MDVYIDKQWVAKSTMPFTDVICSKPLIRAGAPHVVFDTHICHFVDPFLFSLLCSFSGTENLIFVIQNCLLVINTQEEWWCSESVGVHNTVSVLFRALEHLAPQTTVNSIWLPL